MQLARSLNAQHRQHRQSPASSLPRSTLPQEEVCQEEPAYFRHGPAIDTARLRLPLAKSFYTKSYCQAKHWLHRSQTQLAAELIRQVQVPAEARLVILGDTAFDAQTMRQACAERHYTWIVPVNSERVLATAKPRPKVRSLLKQLTAQQFAP